MRSTSPPPRWGDLFSLASNFWQIGPSLAYSALDFGARRGRVAQARALRDQAAAQYRSTTLAAFRDVEDQLVGVTRLGAQYLLQARSAEASTQAADLTRNQYKAGTADFTVVVVAEANALAARRAAIQAGYARQAAAVQLVQALGGGWDAGQVAARAAGR